MANEPEIDINLARRLRGSGLPSQPVLEINPQHPLVQRLNREQDDPRLADWANVLYSQAVLTLGAQIEDPASFVTRLNDLLLALTTEQPAESTADAPPPRNHRRGREHSRFAAARVAWPGSTVASMRAGKVSGRAMSRVDVDGVGIEYEVDRGRPAGCAAARLS